MADIISFSGPQGGGKSSMMDILSQRLIEKGYVVRKIPSVNRVLIKKLNINLKELRKSREGLKIWQYFSLLNHLNLLLEKLNDDKIDYVITDRCFIDFLVYTEITIDTDFKNELENIFNKEIKIIDIFSIKIKCDSLNNKSLINDGIRDLSTYDKEEELFKKYQYDLILENTTINERLKKVMNYLKNINII